MRPTATIAIISYRHRAFIAEAIESALGQDHPDVRIVVSDDSSDDGTQEIIAEYARRFPRTVKALLHNGERSMVGNVNRALAACRSQYVAFLDGDDVLFPHKVSTHVGMLESDARIAICRSPVERFDDLTGDVLGLEDPWPDVSPATAADLVARGQFVITAGATYRAAAMPACCPPEAANAPDWMLAIATARKGVIVRLDEVVARYRLHPGQITQDTDLMYRAALQVLATTARLYPELASSVVRGRAVVHLHEGSQRWQRSGSFSSTASPLLRAIALRPMELGPWRLLASTGVRTLLRVGPTRSRRA
jgi:glycosyltransferase involved in cell wall biosynthesis